MRLVFLGNVADYSPRVLDALVQRAVGRPDRFEIAGVVCPIHVSGRASRMEFTAKRLVGDFLDAAAGQPLPQRARTRLTAGGMHRRLQHLAHLADAPILWPRKLTDPSVAAFVDSIGADIGLVAGLDRILRPELLDVLPPTFNVHPSMLPRHRGPRPEFWQIDTGSSEGGVTIHQIDRGIDTGPIALQAPLAIPPWMDAKGFIEASIDVAIELLDELLGGSPVAVSRPRDQTAGFYDPLPDPELADVPFDRSATRAFDRARAFGFDAPLHVHVAGSDWRSGEPTPARPSSAVDTTLLLYDAVPHVDASCGAPGTVVRTRVGGAVVGCTPGVLEFRRVISRPAGTEG